MMSLNITHHSITLSARAIIEDGALRQGQALSMF